MTSQTILAGKKGVFFESDMRSLPSLDAALLDRVEREMSAVGFQAAGDMSLDSFPGAVMREYVHPRISAVAIHVQGVGIAPYTEFYTTFDNGSSLTTTTGLLGGSQPEALIFRNVRPEDTVGQLLHAHRKAIPEHENEHDTKAERPGSSVLWLAEAIDAFLDRQSALSQGIG